MSEQDALIRRIGRVLLSGTISALLLLVMTARKSISTGSYPTTYLCVMCKRDVTMKEMWKTEAIKMDDASCLCEQCVSKKREKRMQCLRAILSDPEERDYVLTRFFKRMRERAARRKHRRKEARGEDFFVTLIQVSQDDPDTRQRLLSIAGMDSFHRNSMLNLIISELELKKTPGDLLCALQYLKSDTVAAKTIERLTHFN